MALLWHFAQIAMGAAFNNDQLSIGNLLRQNFGGLYVTARSPFVDVLAADDDQGRRLDFMNKVGGLMALPSDDVAQIAFERRHLVDNEFLKFLHHLRMLFHELIREHKAWPPVVVLVSLIALLNHFQGSVHGNTAGVVFELIAILS